MVHAVCKAGKVIHNILHKWLCAWWQNLCIQCHFSQLWVNL